MRYALLASVAGIFIVTSAFAQSIEADNWADAIGKVGCGKMKDNGDGSWTVSGTFVIATYNFANPTLANEDTVALIKKKCCKSAGGSSAKKSC
jgi:hypothetical protein